MTAAAVTSPTAGPGDPFFWISPTATLTTVLRPPCGSDSRTRASTLFVSPAAALTAVLRPPCGSDSRTRASTLFVSPAAALTEFPLRRRARARADGLTEAAQTEARGN